MAEQEPIGATEDEYKQWWWRQWVDDAFVNKFKRENDANTRLTHLIPGDPYLIVNAEEGEQMMFRKRVVGIFNVSHFQRPCDPLVTQQLRLTFNNTVVLNEDDAYKKLEDWPNRPPEWMHRSYYIALKMPFSNPRDPGGSAWNPWTHNPTSLWVLVDDDVWKMHGRLALSSDTISHSLKIYPLAGALLKMRERYEELSARRVAVHIHKTAHIPTDVLRHDLMPFFTPPNKGGRKRATRKKSQRRKGKTKRRKDKTKRRKGKTKQRKDKSKRKIK